MHLIVNALRALFFIENEGGDALREDVILLVGSAGSLAFHPSPTTHSHPVVWLMYIHPFSLSTSPWLLRLMRD
jgi:hypothetical protein